MFLLWVYCREADEKRSEKKREETGGSVWWEYASVEDAEIELLLALPPHAHVVQLLGFLLDAPDTYNDAPELDDKRYLALILPLYDSSLQTFVREQGFFLFCIPFALGLFQIVCVFLFWPCFFFFCIVFDHFYISKT